MFNLPCLLFTTLAGMKSSNPCQNRSIHCVPAHATPDVFFRVLTLRRNSHFPCTTSKLKIFLSDDDDDDDDDDNDDDEDSDEGDDDYNDDDVDDGDDDEDDDDELMMR